MTGLPYVIRVVVPTLELRRPKVPVRGMDLAGNVEAVGSTVTRFQPGDEVFGWTDGGSYAEYACAPEDHFAPKPSNLSVAQAAAVPISGFAALQVVRDNGQVQPGQRRRILSSTPRQEDLQTLRELLEDGKVTPLIDRTFPLAEVPQAIRQMVQGHGGGKVVITG